MKVWLGWAGWAGNSKKRYFLVKGWNFLDGGFAGSLVQVTRNAVRGGVGRSGWRRVRVRQPVRGVVASGVVRGF